MKNTTTVLVVPPRTSHTYSPLGAAILAGHAHDHHPGIGLEILDLNIETWQWLRRETRSPQLQQAADFFRGQRGDFFAREQYDTATRDWAALGKPWQRLTEAVQSYVTHDAAISPELQPWLDFCGKRILTTTPGLIAFSITFPEQLIFALAIARHCRAVADTHPQIVFGGAAMSALHIDSLLHACHWLDAVAEGEGELAWTSLLNNNPFQAVPGLIYRDAGNLQVNPRGPVPCAWSAPDFARMPLDLYANPRPVLPLLTSRACKWRRCRFCAHNHSFGSYRQRPVATVVADIRQAQEACDCRHFYIADQYVDPGYLEKLCDELLTSQVQCEFQIMGRPTADYTPALLSKAFQAGCRWISWGVESGSARLLTLSGKGTTPETIAHVLADTHRVGISNLMMMIFGLPTSTEHDFEQTYTFISRVYPFLDAMTASSFVLFEGTSFARQPGRYGLQINGPMPLFTRHGIPVFSKRLDFRRSEETTATGRHSPSVARRELERWAQRRAWFGEVPFLEKLPAEHYLLYASRQAAHGPTVQFDPFTPAPLPPQRPLRRAS